VAKRAGCKLGASWVQAGCKLGASCGGEGRGPEQAGQTPAQLPKLSQKCTEHPLTDDGALVPYGHQTGWPREFEARSFSAAIPTAGQPNHSLRVACLVQASLAEPSLRSQSREGGSSALLSETHRRGQWQPLSIGSGGAAPGRCLGRPGGRSNSVSRDCDFIDTAQTTAASPANCSALRSAAGRTRGQTRQTRSTTLQQDCGRHAKGRQQWPRARSKRSQA
jgi:hypothetical protein